MSGQPNSALSHAARLTAFGLGLATALHFAEQIIAGLVQCEAWGTCPW
jgi:hypothetical protein